MSLQNDNVDTVIDEALLPLSDFIEGLVADSGEQRDDRVGVSMSIQGITVDMPVELDVITGSSGNVIIGGAPPTQRTETTILPVFHQLKLTVVKNNGQQSSKKMGPGILPGFSDRGTG